MSYQEKYSKYKNKYLNLKSKYGHLLNTTPKKTDLSVVKHSKMLLDLDESEHQLKLVNPKIINLTGGTQKSSKPTKPTKPTKPSKPVSDPNESSETTTDTTLNNLTSSESISSLFKQKGGIESSKRKKKKKVNKGVKHFFQDESTDSSLSSESNTLSDVQSDSDFSSSELDW